MFPSKFCTICIIVYVTVMNCSASLTFLSKKQYNSSLQVHTTHGIVQGREKRTVRGYPYFSYEGIPFAQAPLGDLRFRSPQPTKPWTGVLNATAKGSGCIEMNLRFPGFETNGNEDCLYLNIFTGVNPKTDANNLPVIFWIYGGAFFEGSADPYGPYNLLENGLVVVTFNYRVGMFGFLSTEDTVLPGNYGLKDQNAALFWTYQNIAQFGGDPKRITIAGQSAGACSVFYHMLSPKSKGLFSRAIAWSGESRSAWGYQAKPKSVAMNVAANLGIKVNNSRQLAKYLRSTDINDLKRANMLVIFVSLVNTLQAGLPFTPTVEPYHEEAFITSSPSKLIKHQKYAKVPLIIGMTTKEAGIAGKIANLVKPLSMVFDITPGSVPNPFRSLSTENNGKIGRKVREKYLKSKSFETITFDEILYYMSDMLFTKPIMDTVRALSPHIPIYLFVSGKPSLLSKMVIAYLGYPIEVKTQGVIHAEDLPLIWYYNDFGCPPDNHQVQKTFLRTWTNFAATGKPTSENDPVLGNLTWPPITDNNHIPYLWFGDEIKIKYNYRKEYIDFWDDIEKEVKYKDRII